MNADTDVHYFSNGTDGQIWMNEWCNRCANDHGTHKAEWDEDGCPHIVSTLVHQFDPVFIPTEELVERPDGTTFVWSSWSCMEFRRCPCDRGPEDPGVEPPAPIDPNQGALFDTDGLMPGVWRDVVLDELTSNLESVTP